MVQVQERPTETAIPVPLNGKHFAELVRQVLPSVLKGDGRQTLKGVLVTQLDSRLRLAAADGFRMAIAYNGNNPNELDKASVWPYEGGKLLTVNSVKSLVKAAEGKGAYVEEVIPGQFPNVEQLIPLRYQVMADFDRECLFRAANECPRSIEVLRVSVTEDKRRVYGYITESKPSFTYSVEWPAQADEWAGDEFQFALNPVYLAQALRYSKAQRVTVSVDRTRTISPIRIDAGDVMHVIMPMYAKWEA